MMKGNEIALTADIVVQRADEFLFVRRKYPPFQNELALPGGFVEADETVEEAACRELREETGIAVQPRQLRLIGVFSAVHRDPRGRVVSIAYHCVVKPGTEANAGDDAKETHWLSRQAACDEELAFDHQAILEAI